jgi:hypothetical protein
VAVGDDGFEEVDDWEGVRGRLVDVIVVVRFCATAVIKLLVMEIER